MSPSSYFSPHRQYVSVSGRVERHAVRDLSAWAQQSPGLALSYTLSDQEPEFWGPATGRGTRQAAGTHALRSLRPGHCSSEWPTHRRRLVVITKSKETCEKLSYFHWATLSDPLFRWLQSGGVLEDCGILWHEDRQLEFHCSNEDSTCSISDGCAHGVYMVKWVFKKYSLQKHGKETFVFIQTGSALRNGWVQWPFRWTKLWGDVQT